MSALAWIFVVTMTTLGMLCIIYCCFASRKKGPILSNTYFLYSKEEQKKMDLNQEYRTVAIVYGSLGGIFLLLAAKVIFKCEYLWFPAGLLALLAIVYAVYDARRTWKNV